MVVAEKAAVTTSPPLPYTRMMQFGKEKTEVLDRTTSKILSSSE